MTSSTSSSSRRRAPALGLVAAGVVAAACAHAPAPPAPGLAAAMPGGRPRVVFLPLENLSGGVAPLKEVQAAVEAELRRHFDLVAGDDLEPFLAARRLRYTGGIDTETAKAAREELRADAVLVTTLELYRPAGPPAFGMAMRLVATSDPPVILWMDAAAHAGDESPGLLRLGLVERVQPLQERVLGQLAGSLAAFAERGRKQAPACGGAWYTPKVRYRSPLLDQLDGPTLAVLPFLNQGNRRGAGDALSLEFVRHLVATGRFRVLEPGVVREYLLRARIIMPGGVSLEATRLLLGALGVDAVLSGSVLDFDDNTGPEGPTLRFTATMLDGGSGEVVWQSSSYNRGDDGVYAFGLGRVRTSGELSCRMVRDVVQGILHGKASAPAPRNLLPGYEDYGRLRRKPSPSAPAKAPEARPPERAPADEGSPVK